MPIRCWKCGFVNPSSMDYCGSCGSSFDGTEKTARSLKGIPTSSNSIFDWDERGRISLLLYLGAGLIALSGLLYASALASAHAKHFSDYALAIGIIGFAFALVGLARQAQRMHE